MAHSPQQIGKIYRSAPRGQDSPQEIGKIYRDVAGQTGGCLPILGGWGIIGGALWLYFGGWASLIARVKGWL